MGEIVLPILVVEDNSINSDVALLQLKALGYVADVVHDGPSALSAIQSTKYSVILMDVMMPGMDGWETAERIRAYEKEHGQRTPIIAVTAWDGSDNRERCTVAGMDDYLGKPYSCRQLERVVKRWLAAE